MRYITIGAVLGLLLFGATAAFSQCSLNPTNPSVTICTPSDGTTVNSPVHVVAGTTDSNTVQYLQIYVDGVKVYEVLASTLDTNLSMSAGTHRLTVQAKDSAGVLFKTNHLHHRQRKWIGQRNGLTHQLEFS